MQSLQPRSLLRFPYGAGCQGGSLRGGLLSKEAHSVRMSTRSSSVLAAALRLPRVRESVSERELSLRPAEQCPHPAEPCRLLAEPCPRLAEPCLHLVGVGQSRRCSVCVRWQVRVHARRRMMAIVISLTGISTSRLPSPLFPPTLSDGRIGRRRRLAGP